MLLVALKGRQKGIVRLLLMHAFYVPIYLPPSVIEKVGLYMIM